MDRIKFKRILSLILIAATIMTFAAGCANNENATTKSTKASEDAKSFTFTVTDKNGNDTAFDITTSKQTVGDALLEEGLIEGSDGEYGLYVTKVNGIEAIYEEDGTYWAFYINGEYAMSGVDTTDVEEGAQYAFKVEGN